VKLRYTLPELADLNSILDYIAAHSRQGAKRVQARIQAIIDLLLLYPHVGIRTDDPVIRRMATTPYPYLVFYEVTDTEILSTQFATPRVIRRECLVPPKYSQPTADRGKNGGPPNVGSEPSKGAPQGAAALRVFWR
jgi:plasmid stabilization system protein ParE